MPVTRAMDEFKLNFLDSLKDESIAEHLISINKRSFKELSESVIGLNLIIKNLKEHITTRDKRIDYLEKENKTLNIKVDDQEQYTRRASIRIFGVPESTTGSSDDKVLQLCNTHMKLDPPMQLEEIEVSHRAGRSPQQTGGAPSVPTGPRAILVKFVSRRTKARVMQAKKNLRNVTREGNDFPNPVYVSDDLTPRRAKLAYEARYLKRNNKIADTWVFDSRVLLKDNHGLIKPINSDEDLDKYKN